MKKVRENLNKILESKQEETHVIGESVTYIHDLETIIKHLVEVIGAAKNHAPVDFESEFNRHKHWLE